MKITCFPKYYKNSASSRYRTYQYLDSFNEKYDIEVYPFFDEKYFPGNGSKKIKDLIYLFRRYIKRLFVLISKHRQTDLFFVEKEKPKIKKKMKNLFSPFLGFTFSFVTRATNTRRKKSNFFLLPNCVSPGPSSRRI